MAMDCIKLPGRVLYLSQDPSKIQRQIRGEDLPLAAALPLRDEVSVDEIAPTWVCYYFGERLEDFPYLGLACGGSFPISEGAVVRGGFQVVVSGEHHGTHGSREAALFAEFAAGIRLVLAKSFDPEYLRHCHDLGLLTSTDLGILDLLERGEPLPMELFTRGEDPFTAEIIRNGGLFGYTHARLTGTAVLPVPSRAPRPMTLGEKTLARAAITDLYAPARGLAAVAPGDGLLVRADWRYSHETATNLAAAMLDMFLPEQAPFADPGHIVAFRDHLSFVGQFQEDSQPGFPEVVRRLQAFQDSFCAAHDIHLHGTLPDGAAEGISHVLMADRYVLPGQVVLGTDAHASHSGALGALAFGVDAADLANAWVNGDMRLTVPPSCLVRLHGRLRPGVYGKDLALHLMTLVPLHHGALAGHILEFQGEALAGMATDERATLTNMAPVLGALTGIIAPDAETRRFLQERRGVAVALEPWMQSDPGAEYACVVDVDCDTVGAMLAAPGDPGNALALDRLERDVAVDIAYVGSCSGGKRDDIERVYEVVRWALDHRVMLPLQVQLFIQLGSEDVRRHALEHGWVGAFEEAGARVISPGCGACIHAGPGISTRTNQVTIGSFNRNFPGRSGPGPVWLASPATVAASAFAGKICSLEGLKAATGL
ncbi:MAG: aconitase family protein [Holophaga sp.]|nr:aconitase family protein [Holophaga sp.]